VDAAPVPEEIDDLLAQPSLSPEATVTIAHADPGLNAHCREAGWPPPRCRTGAAVTSPAACGRDLDGYVSVRPCCALSG